MLRLLALTLCLACAATGSPAATVDFSLKDLSIEVIDLTPDDGIAPSFTIDAPGSLADMLAPSEYHWTWGDEPPPLPGFGPTLASITGTLDEGTALRWRATMDLTVSIIDVDNGMDLEWVVGSFGVTAYPILTHPFLQYEVPFSMTGTGGTYARLTQTFHADLDIVMQSGEPGPAPLLLGWAIEATGYSERAPRPIPEPGTYALMLAGLGVVGLGVRRRRHGPADRNRTCICRLGGGRSIH